MCDTGLYCKNFGECGCTQVSGYLQREPMRADIMNMSEDACGLFKGGLIGALM